MLSLIQKGGDFDGVETKTSTRPVGRCLYEQPDFIETPGWRCLSTQPDFTLSTVPRDEDTWVPSSRTPSPTISDVSINSSLSDIFGPEPLWSFGPPVPGSDSEEKRETVEKNCPTAKRKRQ